MQRRIAGPKASVEGLEGRTLLTGELNLYPGPLAQYRAGDGPLYTTLVDLDGDGDADLVAANIWSDDVSVLKNKGDGTFAASVRYGTGGYPFTIADADLDGDGDVDLATADWWNGGVTILRNRGDGTFTTQRLYAPGSGTSGITAADVDGDGDADLVIANDESDDIAVLRNDGSGAFTAAGIYSAGNRAFRVAMADVDGDGDLDAVTANNNGDDVSVLRNSGNGTFAAPVHYAVGDSPLYVLAVDVDEDWDADLVTLNYRSSDVSVLRNNGDGTFATQVRYTPRGSACGIAAADVNGDGHVDLVTVYEGTYPANGGVSVLLGNGDGTFVAQADYGAGSGSYFVAAADIDRDGDADLVTTNEWGNDLTVLRNQGSINHYPTALTLSATSIPENRPAGMVVGMLSGVDPDAGQSEGLVFSLVPGNGSAGNASFTIVGKELRTAARLDYEAKRNYSVRVRATDVNGAWYEKVFAVSVTDLEEVPPTIASVSINDGAAQRSMVKKISVVFNEPVALSTGALTIKLSSGLTVPNTTISVTNPSLDQKTYVLTFSGSGVVGGSLADGVYDLIVTATGVQDLTGNTLTGNYTRRFHRLFGDSDGNKVVNSLDYARLKQSFGRAPTDPLFNSAFDYEGNTLINALDLARFRQRYGLSLSY